jgi:hypothetical protein
MPHASAVLQCRSLDPAKKGQEGEAMNALQLYPRSQADTSPTADLPAARAGARWRRAARACAAMVLGWSAMLGAAGAPGSNLAVTVTPTPPQVNFSTAALVSHAAYEVRIDNRGPEGLRQIVFSANTTVWQGYGAATGSLKPERLAQFVEAIGAECAARNKPKTSLRCRIDGLAPGASIVFQVVVRAPVADAKPSDDDRIVFAWHASLSHGGHDGNDTDDRAAWDDDPHASGADHGKAKTALLQPSANGVASFIPSTGGTIFTGTTGVPDRTDRFATTVVVPQATTADVREQLDVQSCGADLLGCFLSDVTVPGTFDSPFLVIKLRRDASTIRYGAKIANATVGYKENPDDPHEPFVDLPSCTYTYGVPTPKVPRCIKARIAYTKHNAPSPDLIGDWEFVIWAIRNGRFRF